MPTLEEARFESARLATAATVYRVMVLLLGFAVVDVVAAAAHAGACRLAIGVGTNPGVYPASLSDWLAFATAPLALTMLGIAAATLGAKGTLLWRIVVVEDTLGAPDPAWLAWVVGGVAVMLWWAATVIPIGSVAAIVEHGIEYLAKYNMALRLGSMLEAWTYPVIMAVAALAAQRRWRHMHERSDGGGSPYREAA
jgi:hypothetical protein